LENPLNIPYFIHENTPILNHINQNYQHFLAVGVEEEDSGTSMLPVNCCFDFAVSILPAYVVAVNCYFGALSDMEYIFRVGNRRKELFLL